MPETTPDQLTAYLAEVREREQAATKGPWRTHDTWLERGGHSATVLSGEGNATDLRAWLPTFARGLVAWDEGRNVWADARFVAGARTDVPRLLAAVEAVLKLADELGRLQAAPPSGELDEAAVRGIHWTAAKAREAISRALMGEGDPHA